MKTKIVRFEVQPLADDVVLAAYILINEEKTLRSSIWKFKDGEWRMFFHQGTKTANPFRSPVPGRGD
ncbi:hypothetical protein B4135_0630 [Caldibacillus debilis]|uniref:DUF4440 domain-containing protein n=1 Tax=Caldibacillus debilis TaxID=301148 RepID=A0A150MF41_9BACI|nr:hypothetical protein B4135_0630 [Caldibacillus debilis]